MNPEEIIICRCEDISLADLHRAFEGGHTDLETLKRVLRCTMGRCGGRTCRPLLLREIANFTGIDSEYQPPEDADLVLHTENESPEASVDRLVALLEARGILNV